MNKQISKYVSYNEAIKSNTAIKNNIDNNPNETQLANMRLVASKIFDPVREFVGGPLYISSFFRSVKLNKKIGGASSSQHCMGQAIDIDCDTFGNGSNKEIFDFIKNNLDYDQLIAEFKQGYQPAWIHVSYSNTTNRKNTFIAIKKQGKTVYVQYTPETYNSIYG